jgi:hypothetical protein
MAGREAFHFNEFAPDSLRDDPRFAQRLRLIPSVVHSNIGNV